MMDQERDSQLSAMFDGELQEAECELLARRLARDAQLKQKWTNYALIGAVIRDEPLQGHGRQPGVRASRLALGVASAVAAEGTSSGTGEAPAAPGAATAGAAKANSSATSKCRTSRACRMAAREAPPAKPSRSIT